MASLREFAARIRELSFLVDSSTFLEKSVLARLNQALSGGAELIAGDDASSEDVGDYRSAIEELSSSLRRFESRMLERKILISDQLRHMRNVNEWTRSSAETL